MRIVKVDGTKKAYILSNGVEIPFSEKSRLKAVIKGYSDRSEKPKEPVMAELVLHDSGKMEIREKPKKRGRRVRGQSS